MHNPEEIKQMLINHLMSDRVIIQEFTINMDECERPCLSFNVVTRDLNDELIISLENQLDLLTRIKMNSWNVVTRREDIRL